jgi:hypothetical protein
MFISISVCQRPISGSPHEPGREPRHTDGISARPLQPSANPGESNLGRVKVNQGIADERDMNEGNEHDIELLEA